LETKPWLIDVLHSKIAIAVEKYTLVLDMEDVLFAECSKGEELELTSFYRSRHLRVPLCHKSTFAPFKFVISISFCLEDPFDANSFAASIAEKPGSLT
jgi:hypothetical protein